MLANILLKSGVWVDLNRAGKHINVVLAAGTIKVRAMNASGQPFMSDLVSGMAFELPPFDKVSFLSPIEQQAKIWVSSSPLTYAPDTSREVGSGAIESFTGKVFSGEATPLLPAQVGRNKVTISPSQDVLIGGTNLNSKNGISIQAGTVFTLNTQGAVYGLDLSGAYLPTVGALVMVDDVARKKISVIAGATTGENKFGFFTRTVGITEQVIVHYGTWKIFNVINGQLEYDSEITGFTGTPEGFCFWQDDTSFAFMYASGVSRRLRFVNKSTLTTIRTTATLGTAGTEHYDVMGDKLAVLQGNIMRFSSDGGATISGDLPTGGTGSPYGIKFNSQGHIYALFSGSIRKSVDDGATWSEILFGGSGLGENGLAIDTITDKIYACRTGQIVESVDDGATWQVTTAMSANNVFSRAGAFLATGASVIAVKTSDGVYSFETNGLSTSRGGGIGMDGRLYGNHRNGVTIIEGERILAGGIDVALMSEVN